MNHFIDSLYHANDLEMFFSQHFGADWTKMHFTSDNDTAALFSFTSNGIRLSRLLNNRTSLTNPKDYEITQMTDDVCLMLSSRTYLMSARVMPRGVILFNVPTKHDLDKSLVVVMQKY